MIGNASENGFIGLFADVGICVLEGNNGEFRNAIIRHNFE